MTPLAIITQTLPKSGQQIPGCLPAGFTDESLLTEAEFCVWMRVSRSWLVSRINKMEGVVKFSKRTRRIHPKTFKAKNKLNP